MASLAVVLSLEAFWFDPLNGCLITGAQVAIVAAALVVLALEERLANVISDCIVPRLIPELEILPWRKTQVIAVKVYPSPSRPHYLKSAGLDGGVFVRVGSTNRRADQELCAELRRFARGESFDEQAMPEFNSEAIDFRVASELFAPQRKLKRADLQTLKLVTSHQGRLAPTVGGVLLFGRDLERSFPDAWIQLGRFHGTDRARIADSAELRGQWVPAVESAIGFVQKHNQRCRNRRGAKSRSMVVAAIGCPGSDHQCGRPCRLLATWRTDPRGSV